MLLNTGTLTDFFISMYSFHFLTSVSNLICFIEVIKKKYKKQNAYHMPSLSHFLELHRIVTSWGGGKPYEVLSAGYQFKHRFYKLSFRAIVS